MATPIRNPPPCPKDWGNSLLKPLLSKEASVRATWWEVQGESRQEWKRAPREEQSAASPTPALDSSSYWATLRQLSKDLGHVSSCLMYCRCTLEAALDFLLRESMWWVKIGIVGLSHLLSRLYMGKSCSHPEGKSMAAQWGSIQFKRVSRKTTLFFNLVPVSGYMVQMGEWSQQKISTL